eukprot:3298271-Rhodomonas_salina.1
MSEEERQDLFSCSRECWESFLSQSPKTRRVMVAMQKEMQRKFDEKDQDHQKQMKAKEEELEKAEALLLTFVRDLPKDLRPLAEWMKVDPKVSMMHFSSTAVSTNLR